MKILILLTFSVASLSAMEQESHSNKRKAEESTEIGQVDKKAKQAEKVIRVMVDNGTQTIVIPESLARMSRTFAEMLEDNPNVLGDQDNLAEEIQLPQFKATEFNRLIQALQLVKEREEQQAVGTIEKEKSILRQDKHYVLETVYAILDPILSPLTYTQLLEFLDLCNYLDIVDPAGSNFIVEAIMKELVKKYIADKNIKLEDIAYPIDFANEQVQEQFKQLFADLLKDLHPLAQEYIILQRIGAPGKRDIADYLTLFGLEINSHGLFGALFGYEIKFIDKKLTSLKGIELLPGFLDTVDHRSIKEINFFSNFIITIEKDTFISLPKLSKIVLDEPWLSKLQEGAFSNLSNLLVLNFDHDGGLYSFLSDSSQHRPSTYKSNKLIEKNSLPNTLKTIYISFTDFKNNIQELYKQIPNAEAKVFSRNDYETETLKKLHHEQLRQILGNNCTIKVENLRWLDCTIEEGNKLLQKTITDKEDLKNKWTCAIS